MRIRRQRLGFDSYKKNCMDKLIIKNKNRIFIIDFNDIISLNSDGRYTTIVAGEEEYTTCRNLGLLEKDLPSHFFRIHYSHIININKIVSIDCMKINMHNGLTYKIANSRKMETINYISNFGK